MRNLKANNRTMWYALYQGVTDAVDANGDLTGEPTVSYSEPVQFEANLSATRGTQGFTGTGASYDYFGADIQYDLIISTAQMNLPFDEYTLIWRTEPPYTVVEETVNGVKTTRKVYDFSSAEFRVKAVARGLYHMKYAIRSLQQNRR